MDSRHVSWVTVATLTVPFAACAEPARMGPSPGAPASAAAPVSTPAPAVATAPSAPAAAPTASSTVPGKAPARGFGARASRIDTEFGRALRMNRSTAHASGACSGAPGGASQFALYVLALSWAPEFCAGHPDKEECSPLSGFASTHLTVHGLWPNYDDGQGADTGCAYPQYCDDAAACAGRNPPDSCSVDPAAIPADMSKYGPGYTGDGDFLANHEWPKHGSCSGLSASEYFASAIAALESLGGDEGTPAALTSAIGRSITPAALKGAFSRPESVLLSCDPGCTLSQVSICLAHDAAGKPTAPVACPDNVTQSSYDNGCILQRCATVALPKAGASGNAGGAPPRGGAGSRPGQGPACSSDSSCVEAGYVRCAKSGCCTTIPKP
jgi:ribonuclease T2